MLSQELAGIGVCQLLMSFKLISLNGVVNKIIRFLNLHMFSHLNLILDYCP